MIMNAEIKRYAPTSRETRSIEMIAVLDARLGNDRTYLEDRLRSVPDLYRQWRIAETAVCKVVDGLYETLPNETKMRIRKLYNNGEVIVRPKGSLTRDNDTAIVLAKDLELLAKTVKSSECAMCIKSGKDIKRCKIRECFMRVSPPVQVFNENSSLCEYATIANEE